MSLESIYASVMTHVEIAEDKWWNSLTKPQQKAYIKKHPRSKYAKAAGGGAAKPAGKKAAGGDGPKLRGPKKFKAKQAPAKKKTKKVEEKPTSEKKVAPKPPGKKPASKKPSSGRRGRPKKVLSPTEKRSRIKARKQKIIDYNKRIGVLDAERGWRQAAMAYTKKPETKKRLQERMKKITEMKNKTKARIKAIEKRIKELSK